MRILFFKNNFSSWFYRIWCSNSSFYRQLRRILRMEVLVRKKLIIYLKCRCSSILRAKDKFLWVIKDLTASSRLYIEGFLLIKLVVLRIPLCWSMEVLIIILLWTIYPWVRIIMEMWVLKCIVRIQISIKNKLIMNN